MAKTPKVSTSSSADFYSVAEEEQQNPEVADSRIHEFEEDEQSIDLNEEINVTASQNYSDQRFRALFSELFDLFDRKVDEVQRLRSAKLDLEQQLEWKVKKDDVRSKDLLDYNASDLAYDQCLLQRLLNHEPHQQKQTSTSISQPVPTGTMSKDEVQVMYERIMTLSMQNREQADELTTLKEELKYCQTSKQQLEIEQVQLTKLQRELVESRNEKARLMIQIEDMEGTMSLILSSCNAADSSGNALDTMPFPSASSSTSGATNVDKNLSKGTSTVIDLDTVTMADEIEGLERECSVLASAVDTQKAEIVELNNKIRDLTKQCSGQADTINELWGSTCDESIKAKKMQKERDEAIADLEKIRDEKLALEIQLSLILNDDQLNGANVHFNQQYDNKKPDSPNMKDDVPENEVSPIQPKRRMFLDFSSAFNTASTITSAPSNPPTNVQQSVPYFHMNWLDDEPPVEEKKVTKPQQVIRQQPTSALKWPPISTKEPKAQESQSMKILIDRLKRLKKPVQEDSEQQSMASIDFDSAWKSLESPLLLPLIRKPSSSQDTNDAFNFDNMSWTKLTTNWGRYFDKPVSAKELDMSKRLDDFFSTLSKSNVEEQNSPSPPPPEDFEDDCSFTTANSDQLSEENAETFNQTNYQLETSSQGANDDALSTRAVCYDSQSECSELSSASDEVNKLKDSLHNLKITILETIEKANIELSADSKRRITKMEKTEVRYEEEEEEHPIKKTLMQAYKEACLKVGNEEDVREENIPKPEEDIQEPDDEAFKQAYNEAVLLLNEELNGDLNDMPTLEPMSDLNENPGTSQESKIPMEEPNPNTLRYSRRGSNASWEQFDPEEVSARASPRSLSSNESWEHMSNSTSDF